MQFFNYNREAVKAYALLWADKRNPKYYDFEKIGGDCTNFASQCIYAGSNVMNYDYINGWYYTSQYSRSPSWTAVELLSKFLLRKEETVGPKAKICALKDLEIGDIVQIKTNGVYTHSLIVTKIDGETVFDIFVCAHSYDAKNRRLSTYNLTEAKFLKIYGVFK